MKSFISILIISFTILAIPFASASAASPYATVSGYITDQGKPVRNAEVTVTCNQYTKYIYTNWSGYYHVTFNEKHCYKNSTVTVVADYGKQSGENSGHFTTNCGHLQLNVHLVSATLPEFGTLTLMGTALTSISGFAYIRSRNLRPLK